jgi:predicted GIY-YIG superfamily endonuclease
MGLRADMDSIKERYIYVLTHENETLYVGTCRNPKARYKTHLARIKTDNALIYRYLKNKNIIPKMEIVAKLFSTYEDAEKIEIELIKKHSKTCLNFYNNPNKDRYKRLNGSI